MTTPEHQIRVYSQDEVQQILQIAIARQSNDQDKAFTYTELQEIAQELGISPESLQKAERDWVVFRDEANQRLAFDAYRRDRFRKRLGNYGLVNSFFLVIDFLGGWQISWSLYILAFFAFVVGVDAWNTFQLKGQEYEAAFQNWLRRNQFKKTVNNLVSKILNFVNS